MNQTESAAYNEIRAVLADSAENSIRLARAADDARAEDYALLDPADEQAVPERARPALRAAAQRLRALAAGGNRIPVDEQVRHEALSLLPSFPRTWRRAKSDPAELAQKIAERR